MSLSPLAERIYQTLVRQIALPNPLISYGDLVRTLGRLPPPNSSLKANDQRLFEALGEVHRACQDNHPPLPELISIVVRRNEDGTLGMPGSGYFAVVCPHVTDQKARLHIWREEVKRVVSSSYPKELAFAPLTRPVELEATRSWFREPTVIAAIIGLVGTLLAVIIPLWLSTRRGDASAPSPVSPVVVKIVQQNDEPTQSRSAAPSMLKTIAPTRESSPSTTAHPTEEKKSPPTLTLDEILEVLERHHQRATFGAVAAILGCEPRSLFNGYVRSPKTAWVVSKATGLPTGTNKADYPPRLLENKLIIDRPDELREWLLEHR